MAETLKTLSPSMRGLIGIAEVLAVTIRDIDKIYMEAIREVESLWKHKKKN